MPKPDDTANWLWLKGWCDATTRKLTIILAELVRIENVIGNVSPELEAEINKVAQLAAGIDEQVPDLKG